MCIPPHASEMEGFVTTVLCWKYSVEIVLINEKKTVYDTLKRLIQIITYIILIILYVILFTKKLNFLVIFNSK